jgi:hypothetical protein
MSSSATDDAHSAATTAVPPPSWLGALAECQLKPEHQIEPPKDRR